MSDLKYHDQQMQGYERAKRALRFYQGLSAALFTAVVMVGVAYLTKPAYTIPKQSQIASTVGNYSTSDQATTSSTNPPLQVSTTPKCNPSQLRVLYGPEQQGGNTSEVQIVLQNTSSSLCEIAGHPGLQLVQTLGSSVTKLDGIWTKTGFSAVKLSPGGDAHAWFTFLNSTKGCTTTPQAFIPQSLYIIPPNDSIQIQTSWIDQTIYLCSTEPQFPSIGVFLPGLGGNYPN